MTARQEILGRDSAHAWPGGRRRVAATLGLAVLSLGLSGRPMRAAAQVPSSRPALPADARGASRRIWLSVAGQRFAMTLADTEAARGLQARLPLTLEMAELNGNEKHADLAEPLPTQSMRPGTIHNGDVLLYGTRTLVVFYLSFASNYSYTRIGKLDDPFGLARALGRDGARVTFSRD